LVARGTRRTWWKKIENEVGKEDRWRSWQRAFRSMLLRSVYDQRRPTLYSQLMCPNECKASPTAKLVCSESREAEKRLNGCKRKNEGWCESGRLGAISTRTVQRQRATAPRPRKGAIRRPPNCLTALKLDPPHPHPTTPPFSGRRTGHRVA